MARLIEIQAGQALPRALAVRAGDLLVFEASGGRVDSGAGCVELLGAFLRGVVGDGRVLSPEGAPNAVVFFAKSPGPARIGMATGDPWHGPRTVPVRVTVEG